MMKYLAKVAPVFWFVLTVQLFIVSSARLDVNNGQRQHQANHDKVSWVVEPLWQESPESESSDSELELQNDEEVLIPVRTREVQMQFVDFEEVPQKEEEPGSGSEEIADFIQDAYASPAESKSEANFIKQSRTAIIAICAVAAYGLLALAEF